MVSKISKAVFGAAMIAAAAVSAQPQSAAAQALSDRSVGVLMDYAWTILPSKFTTRENKIIVVDKTKKNEIVVPVETGRQVIEVARLSAFAQICNLPSAQSNNYRAMMFVQRKNHDWSDQQLLYISQLHLFTILWLTGNVEITAEGDQKNIELKEGEDRKKPTCSDEERKNVQKRINAYVEKVTGTKVPESGG